MGHARTPKNVRKNGTCIECDNQNAPDRKRKSREKSKNGLSGVPTDFSRDKP
jgi:hypothetical protein